MLGTLPPLYLPPLLPFCLSTFPTGLSVVCGVGFGVWGLGSKGTALWFGVWRLTDDDRPCCGTPARLEALGFRV